MVKEGGGDTVVLTGVGAFVIARGFAIPGFRYLFPLYILSLGYHMEDLGIIASLAAVFSALILPLAGYLVDRGYASAVATVSGLMVAASLMLPVVLPTYPALALAYAFSNAGMMLWQPSRSFLVANIVDPKKLGKYFGTYALIFNLARVVTPLTLGFLLQWLSYGDSLYILGILTLFAVTIFLGLVESGLQKSPQQPPSTDSSNLHEKSSGGLGKLMKIYADVFKVSRSFLPLLLFGVLDRYGWLMWVPMLNAFLKEHVGFEDGEVSIYNSFMGVAMLLASLPAGHLTDRIGGVKTLMMNEFIGAVGAVFLATGSFPLVYSSAFLVGWSFSLWVTSYSTITSLIMGPRNVGKIRGSLDSARTFFSIPAPSIGSFLSSTLGPIYPFLAGSVVMLSAVLPLTKLKISSRK